jgi:hypothetical protein
MAIRELSSVEIEDLVGTRHEVTGFRYPPNGLQPYYQWLVSTLHLLGEASAGGLKVDRDDVNETTIRVAEGRSSLNGTVLPYAGGTIDLAIFNNDTAYIWLYEDSSGFPTVGTASDGVGWPNYSHIKLAEIILSEGQISTILDRRGEILFNQGPDAETVHSLVKYQMTIANQGSISTPTTIVVTAQDYRSKPVVGVDYLRLRVCNNNEYSNATNATISAGVNSTVVETFVTDKDFVLKSHTDGVFSIILSNSFIETVTLRIGPATLTSRRGDFSNSVNITHI